MAADQSILDLAKRTIETEAASVAALADKLNSDFAAVVRIILASKGRVVVSGIGKSAQIASKIVSTLNSTGTASIFMHAADAIHGDLGMIRREDQVIVISNSGNTPEIKVLATLVKAGGNTLIAMTGNIQSELAAHADYVLDASVDKEACPHNLAPTSSTTAQLALGDALAVCLLELRGFTAEDFARFHPGGALGKRLYLKTGDLYTRNSTPSVDENTSVNDVILSITESRLGATAVVNNGLLLGIITDGDLRRMMQDHQSYDKLRAKDIMTRSPKTASAGMMAVDALQLMKQFNITQLVISDDDKKFLGFVHLHDLLKEGIF